MVGISGLDGSWMNTFQPKIFRLKLSIPFHSIPFNSKSQWLEGPEVREQTLFSQKYSLQNKKYYKAYIVIFYVLY